MAFANFPEQQQVVELLQRSLERQRLGHAYLFTGSDLEELEALARTLAKTLNCQQPVRRAGVAVDCCDECLTCRKTDGSIHPDVQWIRPESKTRIIAVEQMRDLMHIVQLTPTEADWKVGIVVAADRLRTEAANAFLKTLEEPPRRCVLILLTTERERLLETLTSRCLRLNFAGESGTRVASQHADWLADFAASAVQEQKNLLGRYRLLGVLLARLAQMKELIEKQLSERSPLEKYTDAELALREKWEDELKAAIESEYRRQRTELLAGLQIWLRDVWMRSSSMAAEQMDLPALAAHTDAIAARVPVQNAAENLQVIETTQRQLHTNVQEALALEVGLLRLKL